MIATVVLMKFLLVLSSWKMVKDITHSPTLYYGLHSNNEDRLALFTY